MITETISVEETIDYLNNVLETDREAITELCLARVYCNEDMADHPTVQVNAYTDPGLYMVGMLGVFNGLFGTAEDGSGAIAADFEVVCPFEHDLPKGLSIKNYCPECQSNLELGLIKKFVRIR